MIKRFLTDFSFYPTSPRWLWKRLQTQTLLLCMYQTLCVCVGVLCKTLSACITTEARAGGEQNPAGSEWVLLSGDRWPVGNLESPNCVLSETATAGAIILSLLNLSLSARMCVCICVHTCVSKPMWVCVCVSVCMCPSPALKALGASGSCEKSILFGSSASLFI